MTGSCFFAKLMFKEKLKKIRDELSKSKPGIRRFVRNSFIIVICLWVMFTFIIGTQTVGTLDMSPALNMGDRIIYSRLDKKPAAHDVIVFKKDGNTCISRVIAVPGDTVEITEDGGVKVNGNLLVEDNIYTQTYPYTEFLEYPLTLKEGEYFVLGDNRRTGVDSRYYGTVDADEILGTLLMVIRNHNF
ncbi:MAG: signal peptidase I [Clostridiales bacterium]|nr:signal peptidase I [Clostridiales bacterium]